MRANCWMGTHKVEVQNVPDPKIMNPRDAVVRITSTAICGSDLHLYDGYIPGMESGDVLGHEFMGVVEELGKGVNNLKKGARVVVPFAGGIFGYSHLVGGYAGGQARFNRGRISGGSRIRSSVFEWTNSPCCCADN